MNCSLDGVELSQALAVPLRAQTRVQACRATADSARWIDSSAASRSAVVIMIDSVLCSTAASSSRRLSSAQLLEALFFVGRNGKVRQRA